MIALAHILWASGSSRHQENNVLFKETATTNSVSDSLGRKTWVTILPLGLLLVGYFVLYSGLVMSQNANTASKAAPMTVEKKFENFDPKNFDRSSQIDNVWMPLKPGTRFVYEGNTVEDDGKSVLHRVVINVTDLTKVIAGIRSVVTWDLDYSDGELVEAELAFFVLKMEKSAYQRSKNVYAQTSPAEPTPAPRGL